MIAQCMHLKRTRLLRRRKLGGSLTSCNWEQARMLDDMQLSDVGASLLCQDVNYHCKCPGQYLKFETRFVAHVMLSE